MKNYGVFHNYAVDVKDYVDVSDYFYNSFNPTLKSHIEYHINCINQDDEFIKLGVYQVENINQIKEAFISLFDINFKLGLIHGDIAVQNTIINDDKVFLIDFGSARVGIVPFDEFIWLNFGGNPKEKAFAIFREAYGISYETFAHNERMFNILSMLNEFDILRWLIYHGGNDTYRVYTARKSLNSLLQMYK
jgi:Ser/Thr protein kinase RdoA (MazF antagonist)